MLFRRVGALILNDKKLLLVGQENKEEYWTPGGKRELHEKNKEALKRELKEELNIEIKMIKFYYSIKKDEGISGYYLIKSYSGELVSSNEINKIKWVSRKEIEEDIVKVSGAAKILANNLKKDGLI